ncbi:MAG: ATP-binding cassette domain-containing protein [Nostocoides sp.]
MSHSAHPIEAISLRKAYPAGKGTKVQALDDLSFEAERGTVFGLLGPNGAGKSTAVKILSTLSHADSGQAFVAGIDVGKDPSAVRRRIGLVSQRPSSDPMATGRENLVLAARIQGLSKSDALARATWLMQRFGVEDAADRRVKTWSGGMSRKLDVAIGLVHRPEVLFLDEPTTGLDPEARAELWAEIGRLAADDEMTVLLTTHYLDEADRLAHRVAIVDHGQVKVSGTPEGLKAALHGDTIHVELANAADVETERASAVLGTVTGVTGIRVEGKVLHARADGGARVIPAVFGALDLAGFTVSSATVSRPSLDDVYLQHAGRTFAAASAKTGAVAR